jgi:uncharacterized membrane protein (UPF0136 family)
MFLLVLVARDQTAASIVNLVLFVVLINLLKGETLAKSWDLVLLEATQPRCLRSRRPSDMFLLVLVAREQVLLVRP